MSHTNPTSDASSRSEQARQGNEAALAGRQLQALDLPRLDLSSPDFKNGDFLPTRASVDGDGVPPALAWGPVNPRAAAFALICQDPDAPRSSPFVHWTVYGIPGGASSLDANLNDFHQGQSDRGTAGFVPAAPPAGRGLHRYFFQLFAFDSELSLPEGLGYDELLAALRGHVVGYGELVGQYERA